LKLHGSKSLAEEKQILRDIKTQQKEKDVSSFQSLEVLKETVFNKIIFSFHYEVHVLNIIGITY